MKFKLEDLDPILRKIVKKVQDKLHWVGEPISFDYVGYHPVIYLGNTPVLLNLKCDVEPELAVADFLAVEDRRYKVKNEAEQDLLVVEICKSAVTK